MQLSNLSNEKYSTRFKKVFNPENPDDMIKYEANFEVQYTATASIVLGGETVIIIPELVGALKIIQIEKETKPMFKTDYSFNSNDGRINLLNGYGLEDGESLFIIYAKLITS
jgi:hypothetical protein